MSMVGTRLRAVVMACALLVAPLSDAAPDVRQLRFTAEEGTWLSLDVAPDGRSMVFELLGDLYSMPLQGGRSERLTSGTAFDMQPRYSPDGRSIVFVSDRDGAENVWVLELSSRRLRAITRLEDASFISPTWAPDGQTIIVSRSTLSPDLRMEHSLSYQLFSYSLDGDGRGLQLTGATTQAQLASDPTPRSTVGAAFGDDPDLIFASMRIAPEMYAPLGAWQLGVLSRSSGRLTQVTQETGGAMRPVLSPDGRYLVYGVRRRSGETALKLIERRSGAERWLLPSVDHDAQDGWRFGRDLLPGAAFTPDGSALIVSYGGKIWRVAVAEVAVTPIPFAANVDVAVTASERREYAIDPRNVTATLIEQPRVAPDGASLTFSAMGRIWIQALARQSSRARAAAQPRQLSVGADGAFFPTWSPDGRYVAYVTWNDLDGGLIWRARSDGSAPPEQLTRSRAFYTRLAYSPDGSRLIAVRGSRHERLSFQDQGSLWGGSAGRPHNLDLVWLPATGGEITWITALTSDARSAYRGIPHFGTDTNDIYITDAARGLVAVRWDGSARRTVMGAQGWNVMHSAHEPAEEIQVSPSGRQAAALVNHHLWVFDVPSTAGPDTNVLVFDTAPPFNARRVSESGADSFTWGADGRRLHWSLGSSWFSADVSRSTGTGITADRRDITVKLPRDVPRGVLALRGVRVITMRGTEVLEDADVLIKDDRIVTVGARGSVPIPVDARQLDMSGRTILPGYVDIHAHMGTPWGVHQNQPYQYLANLAYGVTATRDPQTTTPDVLTYAARVAVGDMLGPHIFSTGPGLFPDVEIRSLEDARRELRRYSQFYRTETIKDYVIFSNRRLRQWITTASREQGLMPTSEGNSNFLVSLTRAFDGYAGQEHATLLGPLYSDVVRLLATSGTTFTPTPLSGQPRIAGGAPLFVERDPEAVPDPKRDRFVPVEFHGRTLRDPPQFSAVHSSARQAAMLVRAGARVGLGSHGTEPMGMSVHWTLWALGSSGMSPLEALRCATLSGAEAIGHGHDFGSIEAGKLADLQILERNPLDDLRNSASVRWVMRGGRLYDAETLNEVWPRQRALSRQPWQAPTAH